MTDLPDPAGDTDTAALGEPGIGQRAASGVVWLTAQKWVARIAGLVTIAILTRFLSPADFGVVAAASTVLPFFYLLSDLGFATYIVQADNADRRVLSTGWWFSVSAGVILTAVVVVGAPVFGLAFGSEEVVPVLQVLAIAVLLVAVASVPTALLRRRMKFRALAVQGVTASLVAQVVAIVMCLAGAGVWALVGQTLTSQLVMTVLACVAAKWLPSWKFVWTEFVAMTRFGVQVLGVEFVAMCRAAGEAAIISTVLGVTALGYLAIAQKLVQVVQDLTGAALLPVTTVAFAKLRDSPERLLEAYVKALRLTYTIMSPPLVVVAVAAPLIIPILFGPGWEESFRVAQFLALAGTVVVGATLDHGLHYGLGVPGRWFAYALATDILTIGVTAVAVHWGLVEVAAGFLAVAIVATLVREVLVARLLKTRNRRLAGLFGFLVVTVVVSGAAGLGAMVLTAGWSDILRILVVGVVVLGVHLGVTWLLAKPVYRDLGGYLARLLPRRSRPTSKESSE